MNDNITASVRELFQARGNSRYGGEAVSQLEHALQAAFFAERGGGDSNLIAAALLHDVGHLLHELPADAPDRGIDDRHEALGAEWLEARFPAAVVQPVKLHVEAKRYLVATDDDYLRQLSAPSIQSLQLQGGPMSATEIAEFEQNPHLAAALALRRCDDAAKVPQLVTASLDFYLRHVTVACGESS